MLYFNPRSTCKSNLVKITLIFLPLLRGFFLSRRNVVQKETMWSLILYVVCMCMCMYVVICKIDHCIHIHWCIPMGLGHNDPWVESHMWPQQMWGQTSSRGQCPLLQVFAKRVTVSTYFDVFSWDLDTIILG